MKKILVAGPDWTLEFGWVLMKWQGYLRKISKKYDEVIVWGNDALFPIYSDFAVKKPTFAKANCWSITNADIEFVQPGKTICKNPDLEQDFIKFGNKDPKSRSIVVHARNVSGNKTDIRNWSKEKWDCLCATLFNDGFTVCCIGSKDSSLKPDYCLDFRDSDLSVTMNMLASAIVCVGPSSGPMHLASLCDCPHVVWTCPGKKWDVGGVVASNKMRYEKLWNPLNTRCRVIEDEHWNPKVNEVLYHIGKELERLS